MLSPMNAKIETLFACLIVLQFAVVVSHDWLDIPGWTHGRQVQAVVGRGKLVLATAINAVFPALAVGFALFFWGRSEPKIVGDYWVIYCGLTVLSAITMWTGDDLSTKIIPHVRSLQVVEAEADHRGILRRCRLAR
jgi:hypothetical protein